MKKIELLKLAIKNFKGCKEREITFAPKTDIYGANASGKTTLIDAFTWLLFDKDSTGASKFQIRPLDSAGKQIDNVEIMAEATLSVDGKEIILRKTQKQKWVKRRGTDVTELQGNENCFEINDYPKSEKDFKDFISDIVDEDLFKLITSPIAFVSMPWKKQREVLMQLVSDVSDIEIAQQHPEFTELIPELEIASTEDIRKKYTKALNIWKKKQAEIPARIDELSRRIVNVDVAELELQKNALKEQIAETEKVQNDARAKETVFDKAQQEVIRIKGEMRQISAKAGEELDAQRKELENRKNMAQRTFDESRHRINMLDLDIQRCERNIADKEDEKKILQTAWREEKAKQFEPFIDLPELSDDALICPTCGQNLPEDQRQKQIESYEERKKQHLLDYMSRKSLFEENKQIKLADITAKGNAAVAEIKSLKAKLEQLKSELEKANDTSIRSNKETTEIMEELLKLPKFPDMSGNQVYEALELELIKANEVLNGMSSGAGYENQLRIKLSGLREELEVVIKKIASADNSELEERISELEEEQRDTAQKVADQERMIDMLERFIRTKMDKISGAINERFSTVAWKLFDIQLNGGIKECCECTVNGVPYSSLNNGHKIVAGLDIISSICELYEITAPIFVDNAESLNDFNIPSVSGQIILLRVSDDKELRVEV